MKKLWLSVVFAGISCCVSAGTWVWTGAADAYWTNAVNWTVDGAVATVPPGRYKSTVINGDTGAAEVQTVGATDSIAEFPAVAQGRPTTIDVDGVWDVLKIIIKSGAPRYVFGTSSTQEFCIYPNSGRFIVESGANGADVVARFGCGSDTYCNKTQGSANMPRIENWSTAEIDLKQFFLYRVTGWYEYQFAIYGTGNVRISGLAPYKVCQGVDLWQTGGAKLIIACDVPSYHRSHFRRIRVSSGYDAEIEILKDAVLSGYPGMGPFEDISGTLKLTGEGEFRCLTEKKASGKGLGEGEPQNNSQYIYNNIKFYCKVTSESLNGAYGSWYHCGGTGTTEFFGDNLLEGPIQMTPYGSYVGATLRAATIGEDGVASSIGKAPLHLGNSSRLLYTGAGEECTRTICLTNRSSKLSNGYAEQIPAIGVVEQGGTGKLTFSSPVKCACMRTEGTSTTVLGPLESATLILANSSAQEFEATTAFADDGDTKLILIKRGTGALTLSGASTYTGATTLEAGTLALAAGASIASSSGLAFNGGTVTVAASTTLPAVTVVNGVNELNVADGATLTLTGLAVTSGSLAITTAGNGLVQMTGATSTTAVPGSVTLNGAAAEFNAEGKLVRRSYVPTVEIPARGGVIPNTADAVVGITTAGEPEDGPITLGSETVTVETLFQRVGTDATVNLAAGNKLAVHTVSAHADSAPLTIGSTVGQGTLAPAASELQFDNASSTNPITVNATIAAPSANATIVNVGDGLVRITSPFTWNGYLTLNMGTFAIVNDTEASLAAKLFGTGEIRKEGAGTLSLSVNQPDFRGTFTVAEGVVTPAGDSAGVFGHYDYGAIVVTNGGQLAISKNCSTLNGHSRELRLSGAGPDGSGALMSTASFYLPQRVTLNGDTTITNAAAIFFKDATLDMGGHDLKFCLPNKTMTFSNTAVTNAGRWIFAPWFSTDNKWAQCSLDSNSYLGEEDDPPIVATNGTRFSFSNSQAEKPRRKIVALIDPSLSGPEASFTGGHTYAADGSNTNGAGWAGPIEVVNANTWLSFNPWHDGAANQYFTVTGPISGEGGVNLGYGTKSGSKGHIILANPHNTYTGPTRVNSSSGGSISFLYPGSIPDWTKVTLSGGRMGVFWGEGLWDKESFLAAANAKYADWRVASDSGLVYLPSTLAINTTYAKDRQVELQLSDADITGDKFSVGHDGEGTLIVKGPFTKPIYFGTYRGSLVFTGEDTITLGAGVISSDWNLNEGDCRIENAADVHLTKGGITVGGSTVSITDAKAKLSIVNSRVTKDRDDDSGWWHSSSYDSLIAGYCGRGVVEVSGDSVVTGRFLVGTSAYGRGALRVRGGRVTDLGVARNSIVGAWGGSGAIEVSGGHYDVAGFQYFGSGSVTISNGKSDRNGETFGGWTTFTQTGGSTHIHKSGLLSDTWVGNWSLGSGDLSRSAVYIAGGAVTNERDTAMCGGVGSKVVFTMAGGEFVNLRPANPGRCSTGDSMTVINLNGGVFDSWDVAKCRTNSPTSHAGAYVNFNGGTYRTPTSGQHIFGSKTDTEWSARVDRVTIYEGGAVIDTPNNNAINVPLTRPTGNGVASVSFTDPGDTFVGSPFVDIIGDGTGASAYAHFDAASGRVTSIEVTSPGCDYTWAKSIIRYGAKVWTNDCALAANGAGGGLVKKGAALLELAEPNNYTGDTVVEDGVLQLGCAGAIPEGSKLVLKGGSVTVGTGVTLPPFALRLTVGDTLTPASLTLAEGSTVYVENLDALDKAAAPYLLLKAGSAINGTFTLENADDLPASWEVRLNGDSIRVCRVKGTSLIFR